MTGFGENEVELRGVTAVVLRRYTRSNSEIHMTCALELSEENITSQLSPINSHTAVCRTCISPTPQFAMGIKPEK